MKTNTPTNEGNTVTEKLLEGWSETARQIVLGTFLVKVAIRGGK